MVHPCQTAPAQAHPASVGRMVGAAMLPGPHKPRYRPRMQLRGVRARSRCHGPSALVRVAVRCQWVLHRDTITDVVHVVLRDTWCV